MNGTALIGFTSAVRRLAEKIADGTFHAFKPKIIVTYGELMVPGVRAMIESTFHADVHDVYACSEIGDIAWQCKTKRPYHINADNVIVEIIREGKPVEEGQVGEVVVTGLNRYCMPIIRFKTGDLARFHTAECPCGCRLPMLSVITGRTGDDLQLSDGTFSPGTS